MTRPPSIIPNDTSVPAALFFCWWLLTVIGRAIGWNDYSWWWLLAPVIFPLVVFIAFVLSFRALGGHR